MYRIQSCRWALLVPLAWIAMLLPRLGMSQNDTLKPSSTHDLVRGSVLNELKQGVPGTIEFISHRTDLPVQTATLDANGNFQVMLPKRSRFYFIVRNGCLTHIFRDNAHVLETATEDVATTIDLGFSVYQYAVGTEIVLGALVFPANESALLPEHHGCLQQLADHLKAHPTMVLQITGHTDEAATADDNKMLSKARALAVKNYLIDELGVSEERLSAYGYGHTMPIASNDSEAAKAMNRRMSFIIVQP